MNTLKKINEEYQTIHSSSVWLLEQMNDSIAKFDQAQERCLTDFSKEASDELDEAIDKLKNLLARCKMELKVCDDFSKKYKIF